MESNRTEMNKSGIEGKILFFAIQAICVLVAVYFVSKIFFQGQFMIEFIWNINTFRGMFARLPENLPKENILSAYALFSDFYAHLPRSVAQNSNSYAVLIALSCSLCGPILFFKRFDLKGPNAERIVNVITYSVIVVLGLWARFFFAYHTTGNHDIAMTYVNKGILATGKNLYAVTDHFNYSPIWLWMIQALDIVSHSLPQFPFMFILRSFVSLVDVGTLIVVIKIAGLLKYTPQKAAALFFLNPISIIISGYHGQIEGLIVFCLLLGIYFILRGGRRAIYLGWFCVTVGIAIKHIFVNQVLVVLRHVDRSWKRPIFMAGLTALLFLALFIPYWKEGSERIIANVFHYSGVPNPYGFSWLNLLYPGVAGIYKYVFLSLLLLWPFFYRTENLLKSSLIAMLLFLVFTPGISAQQFVLPVALGALVPSGGFYFFTAAATLFLCGNIDELKIRAFEMFDWNFAWIAAGIWFVLELSKPSNYHSSRVKYD